MHLERRAVALGSSDEHIYKNVSPKVDSIHYHNCLVHHWKRVSEYRLSLHDLIKLEDFDGTRGHTTLLSL